MTKQSRNKKVTSFPLLGCFGNKLPRKDGGKLFLGLMMEFLTAKDLIVKLSRAMQMLRKRLD